MSSEVKAKSVQTQYDWSKKAPSRAVIEAVSVMENVEPVDLAEELDTALYDHVDPESLNSLVTADTHTKISFAFKDYHVEIDENILCVTYD